MQGTWSDPQLAYQAAVSAVSSSPEDGLAWYRLGCVLQDRKRWNAACGCFARALELLPDDPRVLTNLGWNLHLAGRSRGEAINYLYGAIRSAPELALGWINLGIVEGVLGDTTGAAIRYSRKGVALEPDNPVHRVALSFALMFEGQWKEGLREYEHRFAYKIPEFLTRPFPLWRGEEVTHLYIEGEQGLGDHVMLLRYVAPAAKRAERVTLYVHSAVYALLERCDLPGNVSARPLPRALPEKADAWCPMFSLPVALEVEGPDWTRPYVSGLWDRRWKQLRATQDDWAAKTAEAEHHAYSRIKASGAPPSYGERLRNIGIVWAGSPDHEQAHHRDCPLVYFLPLSEIPNVRLHALQVGAAQAQLGHMAAYGLIEDRSPEITNMLDTAKVIEGLDLVITVDTAVAHLAGAMGVSTWLLLNTMGQDFRWGRSGNETPWYPSMRLFRRALGEQWTDVMRRIGEALRG